MSDDPIKEALNLIPYGWYVVTSKSGDDVNAMVANWITQASFEPRLIAFGLQKTSYTYGLVADSGVFAINLFHQAEEEVVKSFSKGRDKAPDKMEGVEYEQAPETGCPVLAEAAAYLECRVQQIVDIGGDHDLVVAEAVGAGVMEESEVGEMLNLPEVGWSYAG